MELLETLETIRAECDKHIVCETCILNGILCYTAYFPYYWHMDKIEERLKNDNQH